MEIAPINFQFPITRTPELGMRNHPANRTFEEHLRMTRPTRLDVFGFVTADKTGKAHERFLIFLFAGEPNSFGVDHNNEIAGIDMRRVNRLFFAAQKIGGFDGDATEDLVLRVNDPPLAWNLVGFSGKRFHREREGTESMGEGAECQLDVGRRFPWRKRLAGRTGMAPQLLIIAINAPLAICRFFPRNLHRFSGSRLRKK